MLYFRYYSQFAAFYSCCMRVSSFRRRKLALNQILNCLNLIAQTQVIQGGTKNRIDTLRDSKFISTLLLIMPAKTVKYWLCKILNLWKLCKILYLWKSEKQFCTTYIFYVDGGRFFQLSHVFHYLVKWWQGDR